MSTGKDDRPQAGKKTRVKARGAIRERMVSTEVLVEDVDGKSDAAEPRSM
jgi:hypothetical protein